MSICISMSHQDFVRKRLTVSKRYTYTQVHFGCRRSSKSHFYRLLKHLIFDLSSENFNFFVFHIQLILLLSIYLIDNHTLEYLFLALITQPSHILQKKNCFNNKNHDLKMLSSKNFCSEYFMLCLNTAANFFLKVFTFSSLKLDWRTLKNFYAVLVNR